MFRKIAYELLAEKGYHKGSYLMYLINMREKHSLEEIERSRLGLVEMLD